MTQEVKKDSSEATEGTVEILGPEIHLIFPDEDRPEQLIRALIGDRRAAMVLHYLLLDRHRRRVEIADMLQGEGENFSRLEAMTTTVNILIALTRSVFWKCIMADMPDIYQGSPVMKRVHEVIRDRSLTDEARAYIGCFAVRVENGWDEKRDGLQTCIDTFTPSLFECVTSPEVPIEDKKRALDLMSTRGNDGATLMLSFFDEEKYPDMEEIREYVFSILVDHMQVRLAGQVVHEALQKNHKLWKLYDTFPYLYFYDEAGSKECVYFLLSLLKSDDMEPRVKICVLRAVTSIRSDKQKKTYMAEIGLWVVRELDHSDEAVQVEALESLQRLGEGAAGFAVPAIQRRIGRLPLVAAVNALLFFYDFEMQDKPDWHSRPSERHPGLTGWYKMALSYQAEITDDSKEDQKMLDFDLEKLRIIAARAFVAECRSIRFLKKELEEKSKTNQIKEPGGGKDAVKEGVSIQDVEAKIKRAHEFVQGMTEVILSRIHDHNPFVRSLIIDSLHEMDFPERYHEAVAHKVLDLYKGEAPRTAEIYRWNLQVGKDEPIGTPEEDAWWYVLILEKVGKGVPEVADIFLQDLPDIVRLGSVKDNAILRNRIETLVRFGDRRVVPHLVNLVRSKGYDANQLRAESRVAETSRWSVLGHRLRGLGQEEGEVNHLIITAINSLGTFGAVADTPEVIKALEGKMGDETFQKVALRALGSIRGPEWVMRRMVEHVSGKPLPERLLTGGIRGLLGMSEVGGDSDAVSELPVATGDGMLIGGDPSFVLEQIEYLTSVVANPGDEGGFTDGDSLTNRLIHKAMVSLGRYGETARTPELLEALRTKLKGTHFWKEAFRTLELICGRKEAITFFLKEIGPIIRNDGVPPVTVRKGSESVDLSEVRVVLQTPHGKFAFPPFTPHTLEDELEFFLQYAICPKFGQREVRTEYVVNAFETGRQAESAAWQEVQNIHRDKCSRAPTLAREMLAECDITDLCEVLQEATTMYDQEGSEPERIAARMDSVIEAITHHKEMMVALPGLIVLARSDESFLEKILDILKDLKGAAHDYLEIDFVLYALECDGSDGQLSMLELIDMHKIRVPIIMDKVRQLAEDDESSLLRRAAAKILNSL